MGNLPKLFCCHAEFVSASIVLLITIFCLFVPEIVNAQLTCDQCGYCVGNSVPNDYAGCLECMYDYTLAPDITPPVTDLGLAVEGKYWTVIGCIESSPGQFTQKLLQFVTAVSGGIMFIILLYGSFLVLTSAGDPGQLDRGKSLIRSGIIALLLILFAVFILRFVGFTILKIPGFE
jgi:hypothetical protein